MRREQEFYHGGLLSCGQPGVSRRKDDFPINNSVFLRVLRGFFICYLLFLFSSCENPLVIKVVGLKTITFETNGGSHIENQRIFKDQPVKRPLDPLRSGYIFNAWFRDNGTFLEEWDFDVFPTGDITLFAKWDPEEPVIEIFTVTFNKNGGDTEANPRNRDVESGLPVTPPTPPVKEYFVFAGWYREVECINEWNFAADTVTANITLYAKWEHEFYTKIAAYGTATSNVTITVTSNITLDKPVTIPYNNNNITLTITSDSTTRTLFRGFNGTSATTGLFTVGNDAKLILRNIIIDGNKATYAHNGASLVVNTGTFTMENGAVLQNNSNTSNMGGGVYMIGGSATLIMSGGKILGNSASSGGGVSVGNGTLIMNNGEISGNSASSGGGVSMDRNGTFRIVTGTVYGSDADESLANNASIGAALYNNNGTAQNGTFNVPSDINSTWIPRGADLTTTGDTIRVLNGNIVP
jgi:uncharacterized repeat protein (TIGR02543 family)